MDIRCRKTTCRYNDRLTCRANKIIVDKKLSCLEYCYQEGKGIDVSKLIFERKEPFEPSPYRHNKTLSLMCEAKCLFNKEGHCIANGITVGDSPKHAKCFTFAKP